MKVIKRDTGFTIIEVMIALAIVVIMSSIAIPNMKRWVNNINFRSEIRDVYMQIQKARITAVSTNTVKQISIGNTPSGYSPDSERSITVSFTPMSTPSTAIYDDDGSDAWNSDGKVSITYTSPYNNRSITITITRAGGVSLS